MRVLVCGDREWTDRAFVWDALNQLLPNVVIEGHCRGADQLAHAWVLAENSASRNNPSLSVELICKPADWDRYGKKAGPIRNREMLKHFPDLVLAFHDHIETSRGTADMLKAAKAAGVEWRILSHGLLKAVGA